MDVATFCQESRVLVVAGKGGVGKTTMTAVLAHMASGAGLSVLVIELEGNSGIADAFGTTESLDRDETQLLAPATPTTGAVRVRRITPDDALIEYLENHGLKRVSKRLVSSGVIDVVATAIPGIRDVLVLGKVKQLERDQVADLILLDAPATGHAVTFLTSASGLLDAARGGPVRTQAAEVVELLQDPTRCRVILVTLPEDMPVSETIEAAYQLEDKAGVQLGPIIVNGCDLMSDKLLTTTAKAATASQMSLNDAELSALERARQFRVHRHALRAEQIARLGHELPLPQLPVPEIEAEAIGPPELDYMAEALTAALRAVTPEAATS
jgi:anion-transporting  ArsA/GET3 family ATPase